MVTDEDTIFATLIMQSAAVPEVELYPRPLMRWSEKLYQHVFKPYGQFSLQENGELFTLDFCVGAWLSCSIGKICRPDMYGIGRICTLTCFISQLALLRRACSSQGVNR